MDRKADRETNFWLNVANSRNFVLIFLLFKSFCISQCIFIRTDSNLGHTLIAVELHQQNSRDKRSSFRALNGKVFYDLRTDRRGSNTYIGHRSPVILKLHPISLKDAFSSIAILQSSAPNYILGSPVVVTADIHQLSVANPSFPDLVLNSNLESKRKHQTRF